ncbi:hypothetical protein QQS21_002379 [Conoideocrella luteorostrata]|uniref:proline--tRNA ligase n=1 Tax=Conoideocrella luteorostrata TaxID=1105319 RepID=A0AAJ0CXQ6_9HYPO|nr:hypothetical protein QQS21_002379 [Conoideocrella luteorostrata]
MMLSPTHEEEITVLVANTLKSYKDLPLRLYQTTRKYRDEMRPRHGLLRSREFVMKDLYTFDTSFAAAINTYRDVAEAYRAFFAELKIPILTAEASSGDMGGDHSHEYHLPNPIGEDTVITCDSCNYTANDEVARSRPTLHDRSSMPTIQADDIRVWRGITRDRKTLVNAWFPARGSTGAETEINAHAVKEAVPDVDTSINDAVQIWEGMLHSSLRTETNKAELVNVVDMRIKPAFSELAKELPIFPATKQNMELVLLSTIIATHDGEDLNLLRLMEGDGCPRCENGQLRVHRALELGHTFYLGARYSDPLDLSITLPNSKTSTPVEMGCYGIGVSRIFGAIAEHKADNKGLQWPRAIAPFEIVVIPTSGVTANILDFHDKLTSQSASGPGFDAVLDDRKETFGWKMQDADVTGYPIIVVLGKAWREKQICEVQCRSLSLKDNVAVKDIPTHLNGVLSRL